MEAHASPGGHLDRSRHAGARVAGATLVKVGVIGGLAGGMVMAMWQRVVGAIATEPTAAPGIDSSFLDRRDLDPECPVRDAVVPLSSR
jgi:hypothetical protein